MLILKFLNFAFVWVICVCFLPRTVSETCLNDCTLKKNLPCTLTKGNHCPNNGIDNPGDWPGKPENLKVDVFTEYTPHMDKCLQFLNISWTPPNDGSRKFVTGLSLKQLSLSGRSVNLPICINFDLSSANWTIDDNREQLTYQYNCMPMLSETVAITVQSLPMAPVGQTENYVTLIKKAEKYLTVSGKCQLAAAPTQKPSTPTKRLTPKNRSSQLIVDTTRITNILIDPSHIPRPAKGKVDWTPKWIGVIVVITALFILLLAGAILLITKCFWREKHAGYGRVPRQNDCSSSLGPDVGIEVIPGETGCNDQQEGYPANSADNVPAAVPLYRNATITTVSRVQEDSYSNATSDSFISDKITSFNREFDEIPMYK